MHYQSHIFALCIALWCVINVGETARSAINPEILANFAKNVATVLSPAVLGDIQSRRNRSSLQSVLTGPLQLDDPDSTSSRDNIVDNTSNAGSYYRPDSYPYNGLYENSAERLEESDENEQLKESLRDESYLRQERPNFYRPYDFPVNNNNAETTEKSVNIANIESSTGNIEQSSTNLFPSYHGVDFPKAAFHGATSFLAKPHAGFYGFGPYGHGYHHHHHHHPYGSGESGEAPENGTDHRGYGPPFGGHGYGHPYSPFPHYGGYGHHDSFYGPYGHNGNNSNGHYGHHGPYHGGPDFYGPPYGHGYNHGHNHNGNGNNNDDRQTEEPADGDQNNSTKNGYPHHYGPPFGKPILGFPFPFSPFHHFHGGFKGGPVGGVGYPLYADPYLIGFPFHHPYGPFFHGKKYLPKGKPDSGESGESTEAPAGELSQNENPERITALNNEEAAPASSSNQYKASGRKGLKVSLINFERKI
nr:PREDICTED: probable serine/threonine-protein kinase clkA [Linepithema humile]